MHYIYCICIYTYIESLVYFIYYPVSKNIRNILEELHILLAPDEQHQKVFTDIPRIGFKNGKSLKDHLVRSVLPKIDATSNCGPCGAVRICLLVNCVS